jgi:hypothetical protein
MKKCIFCSKEKIEKMSDILYQCQHCNLKYSDWMYENTHIFKWNIIRIFKIYSWKKDFDNSTGKYYPNIKFYNISIFNKNIPVYKWVHDLCGFILK